MDPAAASSAMEAIKSDPDVVVEEALRGKGLGSFMLKVVLGLPEIERCKGCLYTM